MSGARTAERVLVPLAGLALFASLPFTVHPWFHGGADASLYIATARSLVAGEGYTYLGTPFTLRPPGLSLLIAPVIAWRGIDFSALNLLVSMVGVFGVVAFYFWLRPRLGWVLALFAGACLWLNPNYRSLCNKTMSDLPALALLLLCFILDRWAARFPSWRRDAALGVAAGLACYFRTAAILILPAIVLARLLQRPEDGGAATWTGRLRRSLVSVGIGGAIALSWLSQGWLLAATEPADQTRLHSYVSYMLQEDAGDPDSDFRDTSRVLSRPQYRFPRIAHAMGRRLAPRPPEREEWWRIPYVTAAALLAALLVRLVRRRETPEIFALTNLVFLLFYLPAPRLVLPIYVVAFPALVELARQGATRVLGPRRGVALVALLVGGLTWIDADIRRGWDKLEARDRRRSEYFAQLRAALPEDARVATYKAFQYNVYLDQPTFSLHRAIRREGVEGGLELIEQRYGIDTVVLSNERGPLRDQLEIVLERRVGAPQRAASARIWHLRDPSGKSH